MSISAATLQEIFEEAVTLLRVSEGTESRPVYRSHEFDLSLNLEGRCIVLCIKTSDMELRARLVAEATFWGKSTQPRICRNRISFTPTGIHRRTVQ